MEHKSGTGSYCPATNVKTLKEYKVLTSISVLASSCTLRGVLHILTEPVPYMFVSVDPQNNEAWLHYSMNLCLFLLLYYFSFLFTSPLSFL